MCDNLGIGQNIFHSLDRVSASNLSQPDILHTVTGTGTMVTDTFPLGLVLFQDTSLVAVALLCYALGIV